MTTCFLSMIPNGFVSAMSCRDIGAGSGPPPSGDTNPTPSHASPAVQSVRRKLFGDVDHQQTGLDLQRELRQCEEQDRNKYNFDFISGQPINSPDSRYEWSQLSTDPNDTEDNKLSQQEFSTKICRISDEQIAQSSSQSQSATSAPKETAQIEPKSTDSQVVSSTLDFIPTSAIKALDSQPQPSSSSVEKTSKVGQKHKVVKASKQMSITAFLPDRKSAESERKRSAAQVVSHKERRTKRSRLECTSAVKAEDTDTNTTTTTTTTTDDRDTDVIEDEDSVQTTGTPV